MPLTIVFNYSCGRRGTGHPFQLEPGYSFYLHSNIHWLYILRPKQNCRHFADDILKIIFLNEYIWIPLRISIKFVPKVRINNITALVRIMAWRQPGNKALSEPLMISLLTHKCLTPPQWAHWCVVYLINSWFPEIQPNLGLRIATT